MNFQRTNTKISLLDDYYSHFNEDNRLKTRHGQVEFITNIKYINKYLSNDKTKKILDIGAGTGAYSIYFDKLGYEVTAIELVKHNIDVFKEKKSNVTIIQGNALDLSMFEENTFDVVLLFGPMYHLLTEDEKIKALLQAKKVVKKDGYIFVSYYMNDYAVITYGFIKKHIKEAFENKQLNSDFHMLNLEGDLYSMVRLKDINRYNEITKLNRIKIISSDGASNYIRTTLNSLDEEEYNLFIQYHLSTCEKYELLGSSSHLLDILQKD